MVAPVGSKIVFKCCPIWGGAFKSLWTCKRVANDHNNLATRWFFPEIWPSISTFIHYLVKLLKIGRQSDNKTVILFHSFTLNCTPPEGQMQMHRYALAIFLQKTDGVSHGDHNGAVFTVVLSLKRMRLCWLYPAAKSNYLTQPVAPRWHWLPGSNSI